MILREEEKGIAPKGNPRVVLTGAAGLVGQNLVLRLKQRGFTDLVAIDKHTANIATFRKLHPDVRIIEADIAHDSGWEEGLAAADILVVGHAQIGGNEPAVFTANNITATERLFAAARNASIRYAVQIGSSVVNSAARDYYTESKKAQERIAIDSGIPCVVLRPTLMFGWFDRKHLGWLARFMAKAPLFPIPGNGRYLRQPLYVGDFCDIIRACMEKRIVGEYNISGRTKIDYIDLIRAIKTTLGLKTPVVRVPYGLFWLMLRTYALVDADPPFTVHQLEALVTPDEFEIIDWPGIFGVGATPLETALRETYLHPVYSKIALEF
jgi:nucleoside-diphosphate-sugar epimerase